LKGRDEHDVALTGHGAVNNVSLATPRGGKHGKKPSIICNRCRKEDHKAAECRAPHPRSKSKDDWRGGQQQKQAQNSDKLTLVSVLASPEALHGSLPLWIGDSRHHWTALPVHELPRLQ
jgi:hypothetical protein